MKYLFILSAMLCGCNSYHSFTSTTSKEPVQIVVECKNEKPVESEALSALRSVRINDLEKQNDGVVLFIKARYEELSVVQVAQINERLRMIPGVFDIQVNRDRVPPKYLIPNLAAQW